MVLLTESSFKAMLDNNKITEVTANWIDHKYKKVDLNL